MEKPTATYTDADPAWWPPQVGFQTRVQVLSHDRFLPGSWVYTSTVVSIDGPKFETKNTRYIPGILDEDIPGAIVTQIPHEEKV